MQLQLDFFLRHEKLLAVADEELMMSDLSPSERLLELWSPNHEKTTKTETVKFDRPLPIDCPVDWFGQRVSVVALAQGCRDAWNHT